MRQYEVYCIKQIFTDCEYTVNKITMLKTKTKN